jgi:hypothetical protein
MLAQAGCPNGGEGVRRNAPASFSTLLTTRAQCAQSLDGTCSTCGIMLA